MNNLTFNEIEEIEIPYSHERFIEEKQDFERLLDSMLNPPVDNLLTTHRAVVDKMPKCSAKRYVHGIDLLNAVHCYNNLLSVHLACANSQELSIAPLCRLLEEGEDLNICSEFGATAFESFAGSERRKNRIHEVLKNLFKHVHKLKVAGIKIHPQNQRQYDVMLGREDMSYFVKEKLKIDYETEMIRMNCLELKPGFTLRDVLREDVDLTSVMDKLESWMQNRTWFESEFPQMLCVIMYRYKQVVKRNEWKPLVEDAMYMLTRKHIPQNCVDMITKDLENYDLANLLTVAFKMCLKGYKGERRERIKRITQFSVTRSPRNKLMRV